MPKRVLILTADAGFGHRAAANAVAAALRERRGDNCEGTVLNPLDDPRVPAVLRDTQTNYDQLVQTNPDLYRFGYRASDAALPVSIAEQGLIAMLYFALRDLVQKYQPDVIVTTYPLYQAPLAAVFAMQSHYVPLITVVTDLASIHRLWFSDAADLCLVPTPMVQQRALEAGLAPDRVIVTGLPVNPRLAAEVDRASLRAELGWQPELTTALFVASKRVRQMAPVAHALNHSALPLQLALVTGGNQALLDEWQAVEWHVPAAHVYGFVDNLPNMLLAADFVVAKAGGLIVSESLAAGKPLLLVEAIPGQETGNAEFVVQGGAGDLVADPLEALATVYHWMNKGGAQLAECSANSRRLGQPQAASRVADLAWQAAVGGPKAREHRLVKAGSWLQELISGSPN